MASQLLVSIVVPAFNEAENIPELAKQLSEVFQSLSATYRYELLFVDDGSSDNSLGLLARMHQANSAIKYLSFSRNFGHQSALKCGLKHAKGDCVISMDADLQHPPSMIPHFLKAWQEGYEVVYTQRQEDPSLPFLKQKTSALFYWIINALADLKLEDGTADFRLLDRKVIDAINELQETDLFLRGMISWIGFRQLKISYTPNKRFAGQTKYSFHKMMRLAIAGITAFSVKPLKIALFVGGLISILTFGYALYALGVYFFTNKAVPGWTSVLVSVLFIGGLNLITLGIIGEYIGRLFLQAKHRPDYIVREKVLDD